jgi:hypothetical protein
MKPINAQTIRALENNDRSGRLEPRSIPMSFEFGPRRIPVECSEAAAELKGRVAAELASEYRTVGPRLIRQVVNEADSLAATTPYPALLFPVLAEEKVRNASAWATRQRWIREQTWSLAA